MDRTLALLQNADPADPNPDSSELLQLEGACEQMNPMIDEKLQEIDRKHSELSELNVKVLEALELYNKLVNEAPYYTPYSKMQPQYAPAATAMSVPYMGPGGAPYLPTTMAQGPPAPTYSLPTDQPSPLCSLPPNVSAPPSSQPQPQHNYMSQYMTSTPYAPQNMDMSYHNPQIPPAPYPVAPPPLQAPPQQQQQAAYYQQPLL